MNKNTYDAGITRAREAAARYYADGTSELTDAEYDALVQDLSAAERAHPEWVTVSVLAVGAGAVTGGLRHIVPMLSLDNVYAPDEFAAWKARLGDVALVVEPKLDGMAVAVRYADGSPVQLLTRGDGTSGEDVTWALASIVNLPKALGNFSGEVRGEAIFTRQQYAQAQQLRQAHGDKPFANPRNGVAGALRGARDRSYVIPFSFYVYDWPENQFHAHTAAMGFLGLGHFPLAFEIVEQTFDDWFDLTINQRITRLGERRDELPVEIDGAVIKVDDRKDQTRLGSSSRAPRWAVAYKYPTQQIQSVLRQIHWQVGRTGVITPRAQIDPVTVGGSTVTYATLHNPADIARKGFMLGDTVLVEKAGEVIPALTAPVLDKRDGSQLPIQAPDTCPRCDSDIDRSQARWRCVRGTACGVAEGLAYAVSRDALDIDGLGKTQIENLVAAGAFIDVASIFEVGTSVNVLVADGKVAPANAAKIAERIEAAKKDTALARIITALGLVGTGRSLSRTLAGHYGSMDALLEADVASLAAVDKVGPVKAAMIAEQLNELAPVIERLANAGVLVCKHGYTEMDEPDDKPLAGMTVVVTGTMNGKLAGLSRNDMNDLIARRGGKPSSSVSKATSLLVAGDGAGSKLAKAAQLGVRVVTEEAFAGMVGAL